LKCPLTLSTQDFGGISIAIIDSIQYRSYLIETISELKGHYTQIEFRLPPEVTDIRPFQWQGFSYKVNYTYLNPVEGLHFGYTLRARLKKSEQAGILSSVSSSFEKVWKHQIYDLKRFNFSNTLLKKLEVVFFDWHKQGFLLVYESNLNNKIIGSSCVLVDKKQSKAFNLLLSSANSNYQTEVHPNLYNYILTDLKGRELRTFDLYGADLRGVADFKSRFQGILRPHFTVKYNATNAKITAVLDSGIQFLRIIKARII
jgi:hypothetical protein